MNAKWLMLALGLVLIDVCNSNLARSAEKEPSNKSSIAAGLDEYTYKFEAEGDEAEYQIFIIDAHSSSRASILAGDGSIAGKPFGFPATLADLKAIGAQVLISGAYSARIGSAFIPLGYLKAEGKEISGRIHHTWVVDTMACINDQSGRFIFYRALESKTQQYQSCFQTGPRLMQGGIFTIDRLQSNTVTALPGRQTYMDTAYVHLFMCKGELASDDLFGISDRPVTIPRLLQNLSGLSVDHKVICRDAVELAGNAAAGMLVNGELVAGSDSFLLTSAILLNPAKGK